MNDLKRKCAWSGLIGFLLVGLLPEAALANRPHIVFQLAAEGIELKLEKHTPNSAANPTNTVSYSATVPMGTDFGLDVGMYYKGGGLPEPKREHSVGTLGTWQHDAGVGVRLIAQKKLQDAMAGFTALKPGTTTMVFVLDDRPGPKRKRNHASTHVVWRFEVQLTIK